MPPPPPPVPPHNLQELLQLLDIRMAEIRTRWVDGRLEALGFSAAEVAHVVRCGWGRGGGGGRPPAAGWLMRQGGALCSDAPAIPPLAPAPCSAVFEDTDVRRELLLLLHSVGG